MSDLTVKSDTTVPLTVTLPRDIGSNDNVTLHFGEDDVESVSTPILDTSKNEVTIPFNELDLDPGTYPIEFEIDYDTGYVETLPEDGYDFITVVEDLG
jgi:hypothetical protein